MRISRRFCAAVVLLFAAQAVYSLNNVSGKLQENLSGQDVAAIVSLDVDGTMDARDFLFILTEMPELSSVDLSGVEITEYSSGESLFGNYVGFEAGELPAFCFSGKKLQSVILPQSLRAIGEGAFSGCSQLRGVVLPASVERVGDMAFSGCSALVSVEGAEGLESVGEYSFSKCRSLVSVEMPSLAMAGSHAFHMCESLASFSFSSALTVIGEGAFMGTALESVDLSACGSLDVIGAWAFADNDRLTEVVLPSGLESLGDGAFFYNVSLGKVVLPQGLVRINDFTFTGGKLMDDSGFLPASLREIGDYALSDWRSLTEIIIPENVEYIGTGAFRNQNALYKVEAMPVEPPALGEDVWENVDKSTVKLVVPENSEVAYRAADQWKDFFNAASAVNSVESDIKAIVNGNILTLISGVVIREASLYDLNGILLSVDNSPAETVDFYLGGYGGNVYIVRCVLDNDKVELLKIVRD